MRIPLIAVFVLLVLQQTIQAATLHVPGEYFTIQTAINASRHGDTVLVAPGKYYENIRFWGKAITVRSREGALVTVIDGSRPVNPDRGTVVSFTSGEGADSVIQGFSLQNGTGLNLHPGGGIMTYGGGVYCSGSSPTIRDNRILHNRTNMFGAGIYCHQSSPHILNNAIEENNCYGQGGGIACNEHSSPSIQENTVRNNDALGTYGGGGILCTESSSPLIAGNCITGNSAYHDGGAVSVRDDSNPRIWKNLLSSNTAQDGGGIYFSVHSPSGVAVMAENQILMNTANRSGGGIYCSYYHGETVLMRNTIEGNTADDGGGIYFSSSGVIENNVIAFNVSLGAEGGGGIYRRSKKASIISNLIIGNTAVSFGGGVRSGSGTIIMKGNVLRQNTAQYGGGLYASTSAKVYNNHFVENAAEWGGGIFVFGTSFLFRHKIFNNLITGNSALNRGGGIGCEKSRAVLFNNTITNNEAECGGGISCFDQSHPFVANTILWNNAATVGPEIDSGNNSELSVCYSDVKGGGASISTDSTSTVIRGPGMIAEDPLFVDSQDYHITYPSPCRDSGDSSLLTYEEDFEGDPRIALGTVDMGADEFHTRLYITGDKTPGGDIQGKLVGLPGSNPVGIVIGSGVADAPLPTPWGDFYLQAPLLPIGPLGSIPSSGVKVIPVQIPILPPAAYTIPMQAQIGEDLSNLYRLNVLR